MSAIGVSFGSRDISHEELISLARLADQLGYTSLWVGESWGRDAFTTLSMVACQTSRIRLGTGIVPVYSRTPALIAQSIASLDIISAGRALLGLGTSGRKVIEGWHGQSFQGPLERTREYITIIRMALAGQRVDYHGRFFNLEKFRMACAPVQERIPIYLAALGPRNLALTGEVADGWLPTWVDVQRLPDVKGEVERHAIEAGRSPGDITVAPQVLALAAGSEEEHAEARRLLSAHLAFYIGGMGRYYYDLFQRQGYVEESRAVKEAWERRELDRAASLVTDEMLDNVTISGGPAECREKLARYHAAGADMPVITFPSGTSGDAMTRTMEALAPDGS